jgi:hypothetical protein
MTVYSFDEAVFELTFEGAQGSARSEVTEIHIPYSDISYLEQGGRLADRATYRVVFDTVALYREFKAKLNGAGSLIGPEGALTAVLESLDNILICGSGQVLATAAFVIT